MKKNKIWKKLKWICVMIVIVLSVGTAAYVYIKYHSSKEPEITSSFVSEKLQAVSDLTTSELIYTGLIKYSEGTIPFLTQNSFSMIYTANVRAGLDISQVQIRVTDDKVILTLPECTVQTIDIDMDSIEFYDQRWSLFNWVEKADVIDTVSAAKEDVSNQAEINSLLENARVQTKTVIEGLLTDAIGERELVIQ